MPEGLPTSTHVDEWAGGMRPVVADAFAGRRKAGPVRPWERRYRAAVITSDGLAAVLVAVAALQVFGARAVQVWWALGTVVVVLCALPARRAWTRGVLGEGAEEFRRLGLGLLSAAVSLGLFGLLFGATWVRGWVFGALPAVAMLAFPLRYGLRRLLHRARRKGECMLPVIAAGRPDTVRDLVERTRAETHVGWQVAAVCLDEGTPRGSIDGVPVVGGLDVLAEQARRGEYRVVAVTADPHWTPEKLRRLAWDLEGTSAELVVAPVLMEVGGPRLNVTGVLGMPLLRVSPPVFSGGQRVVKELVDRVGAAVLLVLLAPVLLLIAALIAISDRGPVFYRQHRVKRDGAVFRIWKFRTMRIGADAARTELAGANQAGGPLFKLRADPRVTRVGAVLRRFSVDELPQLFNVLGGSMSLVGPRPPLPEETKAYGPEVRRRLLVKPGMTGLWQVSGRSDLSWEDSVRLDLRYVEDWSLALDAVILWKTVRAVLRGVGAY